MSTKDSCLHFKATSFVLSGDGGVSDLLEIIVSWENYSPPINFTWFISQLLR
jgi:hypothetical protein